MANERDFSRGSSDNPETDFAARMHSEMSSPTRFGRLALCFAVAGALTLGVMGTVAYGIWFNQDQRAYAEAMANARQALGTTASNGSAVRATSANAARPASGFTMLSTSTGQSHTVPDGEQGSPQASWAGEVKRSAALPVVQASAADAVDTAAPSSPPARRATSSAQPVAQQTAASRAGRDARVAQQERERRAQTVNPRRKGGLFARMGSFFRRVTYRQHGNPGQQDLYSHP